MAIITTGLNITTSIAVNKVNPIGEMSTSVKIVNLDQISYTLPDENGNRNVTAKAVYYCDGSPCRVWIPFSVQGVLNGDITVDKTWEAVRVWMENEYGLVITSITKELA